jgi:hypothetical protein
VHAAEALGGELGRPPLVLWVAEAPQQADRGRLDLPVPVERVEGGAQPILVELAQHAVGTAALGHRHPQLGRHERRRVARAQPVQVRPRLAAELLEVGEAVGREQRGPCDLALQERVRPHGHPVYESLDPRGLGAGALERGADRRDNSLGLVAGGAGRLRGDEAVAVEQGRVGERSPDVDAQEHAPAATSGRSRAA